MRRAHEAAFLAGYVLVLVGTYLFATGFMTSRPVLETKSDPGSPPVQPLFSPAPAGGRQKFLIVVIDALRIDFALPSRGPAPPAFADRLTVLHELAARDPVRARLFRFVADPPTVTTQRLGGLTGGSLPSFVEAFENFAGETLLADNFVYQMLSGPYKRLHFMGDDTWLHLYPFIREKTQGQVAGFHSFQLFDLHSVDTGVKARLFPALAENSFDVLIAHFLGLDHCGHKFGPLHEECAGKLAEMDAVLRSVIDQMDDATTLVVMGDHGMTDEGDHGGDTPREVSSALLVYSKAAGVGAGEFDHAYFAGLSARFRALRAGTPEPEAFYRGSFDDAALAGTVPQLDFAATMATLAGIPIPYGNIGAIIPELLFTASADKVAVLQRLLDAYRLNAHQVHRYFRALPAFDHAELDGSLRAADRAALAVDAESLEALEGAALQYYLFLQQAARHCRRVWATYNYVRIYGGIVLMAAGLAVLLWIAAGCRSRQPWVALGPLVAFFLAQCVGKTTNSFIIHEDSVTRYLLVSTIVFAQLLGPRGPCSLWLAPLVRLFGVFQACREDMVKDCVAFTHRTVAPSSYSGAGVLLCMLGGVYVHAVPSIHTAAYLLVTVYQLSGWLHETVGLDEWVLQTALPRALFAVCGAGMLWAVCARQRALFYRYALVLLATLQRPFGGWVVHNFGLSVVPLLVQGTPDSRLRALLLYLAGACLFFWSGHQSSISSVHWEVGFTGFPHLNQARASVFLALNTFAGQIVAALAALLLEERAGLQVFYIYSSLIVLELVWDAVALSFLLQHLMLWGVFTPRFLMQAGVVAVNLAVYLLLRYVLRLGTPDKT